MSKVYEVGLYCKDHPDCACEKKVMIYDKSIPIEELNKGDLEPIYCAVIKVRLDEDDPYLSWYQVLNEYDQVTDTLDEFKDKFDRNGMVLEKKLVRDKNYFNINKYRA